VAKAISLFVDVIGRDKGAGSLLDNLGSKASGTHAGLGKISAGLAGMAAPAAGALAAIGGIAIGFGQMAAEAEQNVGAVETVFGSAAKKVEEFSKRSSTAVGLSASSYNELSATTGTALKAAGYSVDQLAEKNDALITRGADLASVFGGTTAEAVRAMGSAFRGEFDPLERYGVTLTMNQVNAELAARGYDKLTGAALESAKKQTIHDLIMKQSAQSAGNFAKEADTTAGAQQRATASFQDASAKLGEKLLPAMTKFAEIATTVATWVANNSELVTNLAIVLGILAGGIVAATGVMGILNIVMAANPVGAVILAVTALIAVIALLVLNWDKVVAFLRGSWENFTRWWGDGMRRMGDQWNGFWGDVGKNAKNVWDNTLGPVFNTIRDVIQNKVPGAFAEGVKWIATHWNKVQEIAKAPVRFFINTVINDGLIGTFNTVAGWVGIGKLGRVGLPPGFAGGGYTGEGTKWEPAGIVHRGEFVFTKEQTEKAGVTALSRLASSLSGYADGGFVNPVPSAILSQRFHAGHNGLDLAAPIGTPIQAAFGGRVTFAQWSPYGGGNEVHIQHAGGWETWYAHMSNFLTRAGDSVNRGQRIGLVGSTGNSTGPHLHYME
jgi:murein DD-endopeptidase MepM/ murein hydrolase activator NlpD